LASAGRLTSVQVRLVAASAGVSERTVWRWLGRARAGDPRMIERLDDDSGLPDPGSAHTLDALVERLRMLKVYAGDPSYESIKDRVNAGWAKTGRPDGELTGRSTVADCFRLGRRRMNTDLMIAVVRALHPEAGYVAQWRQALQLVGA
jgi:hypothetical protein